LAEYEMWPSGANRKAPAFNCLKQVRSSIFSRGFSCWC